MFLQKDSGKLFVFPGKFRQAVSFPGTVLSEMLLTYFLCQGKTSSVFGGVELSDFFFSLKLCSVNGNTNLLLSLVGDLCLKSLNF